MVNLESRLEEVRCLIDGGEYFSINRARQYGKTTMLHALARYLEDDYCVLSLDFQMLSHEDFESEASFVSAFAREVMAAVGGEDVPAGIRPVKSICRWGTKASKACSLVYLSQ